MDKKRISIWGTGLVGQRMFSFLKTHVEIVCFYDSDESKDGTTLDGIPIRRWTPNEPPIFIVIASSFYTEIIPILAKEGLVLFEDFTVYEFIMNPFFCQYYTLYGIWKCIKKGWGKIEWNRYKGDRKLIVFHGGCHMQFLVKAFLHPAIRERYIIICAPHIWNIRSTTAEGRRRIAEYYMNDTEFLNEIDVFIYQLGQDRPWYMNTDILIEKLSAKCQKIALSPLEFLGYFPQCRSREYKWSYQDWYVCYSPRYKDYYVNKLFKQGKSEDEIVNIVKANDFLSSEEIQEFFRVALELFRIAEESATVKIYDYIEENCRNEQLFYNPAHPKLKVYLEYANRIIRFLIPECNTCLQDYFSEATLADLFDLSYDNNVPLYPCVCRVLGLSKYDKTAYMNRWISERRLTFDEYIREYIRIIPYDSDVIKKGEI